MTPTLSNLQIVKSQMETLTAQSPELEDAVTQAKGLVRQLLPEKAEEFEAIAVEPSKTTSNFVWPGGTRQEFEIFTRNALEQQNYRIETMRLAVIQSICELLEEQCQTR